MEQKIESELAVIGCKQLVTLAGPARPRVGHELSQLAIIADGAMLVRDGRIARIGRREEIEPLIGKTTRVVNVGGRVVLPGFVDAHTHAVFAGTRADEFELRAAGCTYREIAARGGGILSTVRRTRAATEEELFRTARRRLAWFVRAGTTTLEVKSGYGLSVDDELKILRVVRRLGEETRVRTVPTFLGAHEVPDEYRAQRASYIELIVREMLPRVAREGLARFADAFCEEGIFSTAEVRRVLSAARACGLGLRIHADQFSNSGGAKLAAELGATTADHLERTDEEGIAALRAANVQPVLLPASVYALGSHEYPAARRMIEAGLAVVLATDFNPGTSPTPSVPMVLSLAVTQMRMSPAEAITAATINAAYSLSMGGQIGSLEVGKQADFAVHDVEDYRELAYFFGIEPAWETYIGGERVFARHAPNENARVFARNDARANDG
ncbi:MAG: imidazolonepropionase [Pyrinomonas sp.]|uniref:imidazolonepropionase n=1 Tax=Pyrinomonas sp. TaxID=2080306 RepID=UPI00332BC51F